MTQDFHFEKALSLLLSSKRQTLLEYLVSRSDEGGWAAA